MEKEQLKIDKAMKLKDGKSEVLKKEHLNKQKELQEALLKVTEEKE